jgi:hypothetical protein
MVIKEFERIRHCVVDGHGARAVIGMRNINCEFQVIAFAAGFEFKLILALVRNALHIDKGRPVQKVRIDIVDGNRAVDTLPRADELNSDIFGHVDVSVGEHSDAGIKVGNRITTFLRGKEDCLGEQNG